MKYLFGPVPSRRIGISLGIDFFSQKTCTYDCVYCECGKTSHLSLTRKEYAPFEALASELNAYLDARPLLDYITFSGSGEPTLYSRIGEVVTFIKKKHPSYKICVITNGSLLYLEQVRSEIKDADLIIPSLDAVSHEAFVKINRPHPGLAVETIVQGLVSLGKEYKGHLWLEIFIIPGVNDTRSELDRFKIVLDIVKPEKVQLNILDRPGVEKWVKPADRKDLEKIAEYLEYEAIEIITSKGQDKKTELFYANPKDIIIQTLKRRPCTIEDLSKIVGILPKEITRYLDALIKEHHIEIETQERGTFFKIQCSHLHKAQPL
ncbi:MAG: radical SAM protein [Pseudomonadota bacterium]